MEMLVFIMFTVLVISGLSMIGTIKNTNKTWFALSCGLFFIMIFLVIYLSFLIV